MLGYPQALIVLINFLKRLPGVGSKTAERFAFELLKWPPEQLQQFSSIIRDLKEKIIFCPECHCILDKSKVCKFCDQTTRDNSLLCVVASAKDVLVLESTRCYRGLYHVLDGLISPLDDVLPESIGLDKLKTRINKLNLQEIIFALDSTLEGDATSLFLKQEFEALGIKTSKLASGVPLGSSLDFVDEGTLTRALKGRCLF